MFKTRLNNVKKFLGDNLKRFIFFYRNEKHLNLTLLNCDTLMAFGIDS